MRTFPVLSSRGGILCTDLLFASMFNTTLQQDQANSSCENKM